MSELFPLFTQFSAQATGALVSAVWEGALLAAIVGLTLRLFPRLSPAARSVIWLNVFILLALLHLVPFALSSNPAPRMAPHAVLLDSRWSLAVAATWLALSVIRAVQLVISAFHLHALAGRALPVGTASNPDSNLAPLLRAPFNRRVQLCSSTEVARPSVLGFFRPRILVPPVVLNGLSPLELRQVVIHEMEHLRRGDDWTNLLQKLALVVFPLNPALLWVERRLCAERELACDDRVLRSGSGRKAYALCLTHLAEFALIRKGFSLALGAWERRPELVRRVQRILAQPVRSMGRRPALAVCGALLSGVFACTITLAHAPQVVGFVPATDAQQQQARITPSFDFVTDATMVHAMGNSQMKAVSAVRRTQERTQEQNQIRTQTVTQTRTATRTRTETAYARTIALKSRPARTMAMPCKVKFSRKHRNLPELQPARLADLRKPAPPVPAECPHEFAVLARWTEMQNAVRAADVVANARQMRRFNVVSAVYVLRTPNGWVIIQI